MLPIGRVQCAKGSIIKSGACKFKIFKIFILLKSAIYAIGNSIFHNDLLYGYVEEYLHILIKLLNDSLAKTRIHSAGNFQCFT